MNKETLNAAYADISNFREDTTRDFEHNFLK